MAQHQELLKIHPLDGMTETRLGIPTPSGFGTLLTIGRAFSPAK